MADELPTTYLDIVLDSDDALREKSEKLAHDLLQSWGAGSKFRVADNCAVVTRGDPLLSYIGQHVIRMSGYWVALYPWLMLEMCHRIDVLRSPETMWKVLEPADLMNVETCYRESKYCGTPAYVMPFRYHRGTCILELWYSMEQSMFAASDSVMCLVQLEVRA